jgi:hypothetical protein
MRLAASVSGARYDATDKAEPAAVCQHLLRSVEQSVLSCPAWPHHQNQHLSLTAVVDRPGRKVNLPPR